jgi:hypothetical protein
MHGPINVKPPNNTSKWQMGFNSAFKVLREAPVRGTSRQTACTGSPCVRWCEQYSGVKSRVTTDCLVSVNVGQETRGDPIGLLTVLSAFHPATEFCVIISYFIFIGNRLCYFEP